MKGQRRRTGRPRPFPAGQKGLEPMDYTSARGSDYTDYRGMQVPTLILFSDLLLTFVKEAETVSGGLDEATTCSDSGRLTFLKETARSQERLVLRATNAHQTMYQWLLFAKNRESSQTNRL